MEVNKIILFSIFYYTLISLPKPHARLLSRPQRRVAACEARRNRFLFSPKNTLPLRGGG